MFTSSLPAWAISYPRDADLGSPCRMFLVKLLVRTFSSLRLSPDRGTSSYSWPSKDPLIRHVSDVPMMMIIYHMHLFCLLISISLLRVFYKCQRKIKHHISHTCLPWSRTWTPMSCWKSPQVTAKITGALHHSTSTLYLVFICFALDTKCCEGGNSSPLHSLHTNLLN